MMTEQQQSRSKISGSKPRVCQVVLDLILLNSKRGQIKRLVKSPSPGPEKA